MRCYNCGYDNSPESKNCVKCNALLNTNQSSDNSQEVSQSIEGIKGTLKGQQLNVEPWDCPKCGRPVVPGSGKCNFCGFVFNSGDNSEAIYKDKSSKIKGTIDPYEKGFVLKPISTQYENEFDEIKFRAGDENIILGRDKLEKDNFTISQEQAQMEFRNGKWYIKNLSEKKSTFVFAGDYTELNDGDIILIGDRRFVFTK